MSESTVDLRRKITGAGDLQSVVRAMKALAASNIGQYEKSVRALGDYYRAVELGLAVCFRGTAQVPSYVERRRKIDGVEISAVVFGSDQGLVGKFNDVIADYAHQAISLLPGNPRVWVVGERLHARLADMGLSLAGLYSVPNSVHEITSLIGAILVAGGTVTDRDEVGELHLFHNRPASGQIYFPVRQRLLPLDENWRSKLAALPWPTDNLPEVVGGGEITLRNLIREYLFISMFKACAESLASENASRLAAMQRAENNIDELLAGLKVTFHRLRQNGIDAELFDVISGFEALAIKEASDAIRQKSKSSSPDYLNK